MHSEIQALDEVIRIVLYTTDILNFLDALQTKPTPIFIDKHSVLFIPVSILLESV